MDFLHSYLLQEIYLFEYLEGFVYFVSGILASILLALSIYAYRKKYVKKILYAIMAFAFFTSYLFFEALEVFYPVLESFYIIDIGAASITTLVVIFFFIAIVKK